MFQGAVRTVFPQVFPILIAKRFANGKATCQVGGAAMMVNSDGWFVTAGHILQEIHTLTAETQGERRPDKGRARVTHFLPIFSSTRATLAEGLAQTGSDVGFGRLQNYPPPQGYPRFRSRPIEVGEFLCRIGFPFTKAIETTWTKEGGFVLNNPFPVPGFVNEALVSRFRKLPTGLWMETSSPGLRGQSGGPLIDTAGFVCGIQSNTAHYPLGFEKAGRNQVLNVGRAVHVETVTEFAKLHGIKYLTEEEET
ncbi:MAG: trypsin-like peptidase domain-containing protein [Acidobacteria bacterium]|nr:trypsin-like peptidase domain-containing protein [Acidobacteriota bacterium]MYG35011.1 trypsin-like peptidase domain-containing protein [Gemmatimonadota bacterium]